VADSAAGYAGSITELLGNPTLRAELGGHAAAFVRAGYSWDVTTARLAEVVETVVPLAQAVARGRAARADLA
jgi:glycosyltransferase involved in cell wall biosynthesis